MNLDQFQKLSLEHCREIGRWLSQDPPSTSELTFSNLFMWRHLYQPAWTVDHDCLLVVMSPPDTQPFALPPVGAGDKAKACQSLAQAVGRVERAPRELAELMSGKHGWKAEATPEHDDYVYLRRDLVELKGKRYHGQKNHLNKFLRQYRHTYKAIDQELVECVLDMQENWCRLRDCQNDPALAHEDRAVFEALKHYEELGYQGGAILINEQVEAFTLGEKLSPDTAVIHLEKANTKIPGLYATINQMFAANGFGDEVEFLNREQDLGLPGLRKAKKSYHPHHLVEKFTLTPN
jgi:uncharacterized protein